MSIEIVKSIAPYIISIITSFIAGWWSYIASKKKLNQEIQIVNANNEHEIDKLIKQHNIDIENLKEKHKLELELKEKEFEHEKELITLKSKNSITEKSQETMNQALSKSMEGFMSDLISGKKTAKDLEELAKQFPKNS